MGTLGSQQWERNHPEQWEYKAKQPPISPVFSAAEGLNPAFNPRQILIQAGDIEENPGPNPGPKCDSCGGTIRRGTAPFQCSSAGCNRICHKQLKCSRVSRLTTTNQEWICNSHRTSSATDTDTDTDSNSNTNTISNHSQRDIGAEKQKDPSTRNQCGACGKGFSSDMQTTTLPRKESQTTKVQWHWTLPESG